MSKYDVFVCFDVYDICVVVKCNLLPLSVCCMGYMFCFAMQMLNVSAKCASS